MEVVVIVKIQKTIHGAGYKLEYSKEAIQKERETANEKADLISNKRKNRPMIPPSCISFISEEINE